MYILTRWKQKIKQKIIKLRTNDTRQENTYCATKETDTKIIKHGDLKEAWGRSMLRAKPYIASTVLFIKSNHSKISCSFS